MLERGKKRLQSLQFGGSVCFKVLNVNLLNFHFFFLKNVIDRKPYPDDENVVEVKFARTPVMSTYLVAFVVGEYDFVETRSKDGVCVRVYTPVGKAEQGKFALEVNVLEEDCSNSP